MNFRNSLEKAADQTASTVQHPIRKLNRLSRLFPNSLSAPAGRTMLLAQKNSPTILFVGGVAGVIGTTVLACRATLKLEGVLEEAQAKMAEAKELRDSKNPAYPEKDYRHDMAYLYIRSAVKVTRLFGPTFILGITSISALTGSHNILSKRNVALTAAYNAVAKGFEEYRGRVIEEFGEDKDREFRYSTEEKTVIDQKPNGKVDKEVVKHVGRNGELVYAKFFQQGNRNWEPTPEVNLMFLRMQQNYLNNQLRSRGHVFLNEAYDELGFERTSAGQSVGWLWNKGDGDKYIDFGVFSTRNLDRYHDFVIGRENCILVDFNVDGPIYDKI